MRVCVMIEGQEGVTWEQWLGLARACEDAGVEGLFRSDHYTGFIGAAGGSHDAWATICGLGAVTERIQLGTMVSPATFRHPSVLARMVVTASHISGGRVELGLGAGWHEGEHREHGFPFPSTPERMAIFAEQLEIIHRSWSGERFDHEGEHYRLLGAHPQPLPLGHVNVIVGGTARPGTIEPAVRFADEYNTVFCSPEEAGRRRGAIDAACERAGRAPLTFSLMTGCLIGRNEAELARRVERVVERYGAAEVPSLEDAVNGTVAQAAARLREYEAAGVERVMLNCPLPDDLEMIELIGRELAPQLA